MTQQFEPFQKVLVRDGNSDNWQCGFFSHMRENKFFKYAATDGVWGQCIPYEGNEHLVGTSNSPVLPEPEFQFGDKVEVSDDYLNWFKAIYIFHKPEKRLSHAAMREKKLMYSFWRYCRKADW